MSTGSVVVSSGLPKVGIVELVNSWTLLGIAAVSVAENTASSETPGTSKFQTAIDIIKAEAGLTAEVDPVIGALANSLLGPIVNGIVLVNNIKGLFKHKTPPPAAPAVVAKAA